MQRAPADARTENELCAAAVLGDAAAWDALVARFNRKVVVAMLGRGVRLQEAKDLAQDAWIRLFEKQQAGQLETLQLPGLAIAQATWLAKEAHRSKARRNAIANTSNIGSSPPARDPGVSLERKILDREQLSLAFQALARCSTRDQAIFRAAYGRTPAAHSAIATEIGISLQRVRQVLCEVRAKLRAAIGDTRTVP